MKKTILGCWFMLSVWAQGTSYVVIVVDDLGYMDIGAYNPDTFYETPNIDRLAASGVKFTDGYAANPVCSPTRFGIQTGRYPTRKNATNFFGGNRSGKFAPAKVDAQLDLDEVTIAEALKKEGYTTFFAGKWHLGEDAKFWPEKQGYDFNYGGFKAGGPYGGKKYFSPYGNPRLEDGPDGEHLPDRLATETCRFIESNKGKDFYAMLSFYSVHTPLIGRPDLVEKYRKKAEKISGREFGTEEQVLGTGPRKVRILQKHAVYAAMVEAMDQAVGKVMKKLEELGLEDEVVVCFTSDNGGLSTSEGWPTSNLPLRGGKGWIYEGGIREPFIVCWPGVTKPGAVSDVPVMSTDFFPTLVKAAGGKVGKGVDGVDLLPLLGGGKCERDALFWHYPHYSNQGGFPSGAVRMGDWKLVERYEDGRVHLYNLKDDIGEQKDVKEGNEELVEKMRKRLHAWYLDVDAKFLQEKKGSGKPWRP
ncbi:MAG: sulfatase [Akkermansiaceae bacterium]